jgi:membrane-bound lytic murein transglycosylase B
MLVCALLAALLIAIGVPLAAAEKPLAADLVTDGQPIDLTSTRYQELFAELHDEYGFTAEELHQLFAGVQISKRVLELMDKQWEAKPYYLYRPLFVTPATIAKGKQKLAEHRELLDRIEIEFGVNREVIIAIWGIESRFGTHRGSFNVFQTLNTSLTPTRAARASFAPSLFTSCCYAGKTTSTHSPWTALTPAPSANRNSFRPVFVSMR